jgi:actin-related protein 3
MIYPIKSGIIDAGDWEIMEKMWHRCMFHYLRCEPEESVVVLTEPPMNPPENRE